MKIVQEKSDNENFIELSISPKEFDFIKEYMIISKKCFIQGMEMHIGIKLEIYDENDDDENEVMF